MAQTLAGLEMEAAIKGPWLARRFPRVTKLTIKLCALHWHTLCASPGEQMWAVNMIKRRVGEGFPLIYSWLLKMVASLVIYWLLNKRSLEFDKDMERISYYL
tara:strand:+ start:574 stop:879 length:306 start_codon:yes stop_codon:yes gene_type:complete